MIHFEAESTTFQVPFIEKTYSSILFTICTYIFITNEFSWLQISVNNHDPVSGHSTHTETEIGPSPSSSKIARLETDESDSCQSGEVVSHNFSKLKSLIVST